MADDAFALSPISARAAQPSEADYDAIRDAFMETSRGRWFLGEYAKRNRNADTRMVLDAVARIEEALSAQRRPPPDDKLPEALEAIRNAVDRAADVASAAVSNLALEDNLAPVRKGARIIKEISWRWREIGADSRICDLIDSQVSAIEASCGQISEIDPRPGVGAAFDLIRDRIDDFGDNGDDAAPTAANGADLTAAPEPPAPPEPEAPVVIDAAAEDMAVAGTVELEASEPAVSEPVVSEPDPINQDQPIEAAVSAIEVADPTEDAAQEASQDAPEDAAEAADAQDEAILDMVALEMAAPDETGAEDYFSAIDEDEVATAAATAAVIDPPASVEAHAPTLAPQQPQPLRSAAPPAPTPSVQPSLGSTLLANGFLEQHRAPTSDSLAPIRRMSQAERIAFFS